MNFKSYKKSDRYEPQDRPEMTAEEKAVYWAKIDKMDAEREATIARQRQKWKTFRACGDLCIAPEGTDMTETCRLGCRFKKKEVKYE